MPRETRADPATLTGAALAAWYERSPEDLRLAAEEQEQRRWADYAARTRILPRQHEELQPALSADSDPSEVILIGNPENPKLRRQHERERGPWPYTEDGRPYDVGHRKALADGGTNTLDNIEPIHPDEHRARHRQDGDFSRWARRAGIARAFGGRVVRGLGPLSSLVGLLTGSVRLDSLDNFASDMMGWPSEEDRRRAIEREQKIINPQWKPGDPIVV